MKKLFILCAGCLLLAAACNNQFATSTSPSASSSSPLAPVATTPDQPQEQALRCSTEARAARSQLITDFDFGHDPRLLNVAHKTIIDTLNNRFTLREFTNHYSQKLQKCLIQLTFQTTSPNQLTVATYRVIVDLHEKSRLLSCTEDYRGPQDDQTSCADNAGTSVNDAQDVLINDYMNN